VTLAGSTRHRSRRRLSARQSRDHSPSIIHPVAIFASGRSAGNAAIYRRTCNNVTSRVYGPRAAVLPDVSRHLLLSPTKTSQARTNGHVMLQQVYSDARVTCERRHGKLVRKLERFTFRISNENVDKIISYRVLQLLIQPLSLSQNVANCNNMLLL